MSAIKLPAANQLASCVRVLLLRLLIAFKTTCGVYILYATKQLPLTISLADDEIRPISLVASQVYFPLSRSVVLNICSVLDDTH